MYDFHVSYKKVAELLVANTLGRHYMATVEETKRGKDIPADAMSNFEWGPEEHAQPNEGS